MQHAVATETCVRRQASKYRRGRLHTGSSELRICGLTMVLLPTHKQGERLGFDLVVADPTRHGRLPTGSQYFKRGQAAALAVHREKCAWSAYQLRYAVDYRPIGIEVTGGLGKKAAEFFNDIVKAAQQAKTATISPSEWSWSAQSFSSFWMMRISFTVAKITALAVHHGVRRALAAHAEL